MAVTFVASVSYTVLGGGGDGSEGVDIMAEEKVAEEVQGYGQAVAQIKQAILNSQYSAAKQVNAVMLSLYYGVGRYISQNTRAGKWGSGAVKAISEQLRRELPGLRGFGERNIYKMRTFFEEWDVLFRNFAVATAKLQDAVVQDVTQQLVAINEPCACEAAGRELAVAPVDELVGLPVVMLKELENATIGLILC